MRQILQKEIEWNWTEREENFNEIKRKITEKPCLAHFARNRDNIVSTDASRSGLGITLGQKQNDDKVRPFAFASRYLNDVEIYSIGELDLLAVVWGLEEFCLKLYGNVVHLYTYYRALEPLNKRNRAYRQNSAQLTKWLDRLAHFDISLKHSVGKT